MSGGPGFYRGTSYEQTPYFANKERKMIESKNWPSCFSKKVDMSKVSLEIIRPWISRQITSLLGIEDEIVIDYCMSQLRPEEALTEEQTGSLTKPYEIDPKKLQINLTGFMAKHTGKFVKELWELLLSAQENASGIPQQFIDEKKEELKRKQEEQIKLQEELVRRQESLLEEAKQYQNMNAGKNSFSTTNFQNLPTPEAPKGFSSSFVEDKGKSENDNDKNLNDDNHKSLETRPKESPKIAPNDSSEKEKNKNRNEQRRPEKRRSPSSSSTSSRSRSSSYSSSNSSVSSRRPSYHRSHRGRRSQRYSRSPRYQKFQRYPPDSRNRPRYRSRYPSPVRPSTYNQRRNRYASPSRSSSHSSSYSNRSSPIRDSRNSHRRNYTRNYRIKESKDNQTREKETKTKEEREVKTKPKTNQDPEEQKVDKRSSPKRRYEAAENDSHRSKRRKPDDKDTYKRNRNRSPSSSSNSRSPSRHSRHRNRPTKQPRDDTHYRKSNLKPSHKTKPSDAKSDRSASIVKDKTHRSVPPSPTRPSSPHNQPNTIENIPVNKKPRPTGRLRAWSTSSSNPSERRYKKSRQADEKDKDDTNPSSAPQINGMTQHKENINTLDSQDSSKKEISIKHHKKERSHSEENLRQKALGIIKKVKG